MGEDHRSAKSKKGRARRLSPWIQPDLGLMWSQIAGVLHFVQVQALGRELCDRPTRLGPDFHIEHLGSDHATNGTLVHGKDVAARPVPALVVMASVDAHHNPHLRLVPIEWI